MDYAFKAILIIYWLSPCAVYCGIMCYERKKILYSLWSAIEEKEKKDIKKGVERENRGNVYVYIFIRWNVLLIPFINT
jgi:hypothetical protein